MIRRKPRIVFIEEYERFRDYLVKINQSEVKLKIEEIEKIIGCDFLCDSAYNHKVWWSGSSHPISKIWLEEGYKLKELELGSHIILEKTGLNL